MTAVDLDRPAIRSVQPAAAVAVVLGMAVLLLRPAVGPRVGWTTLTVTVLFGAVLTLGLTTPVDRALADRVASAPVVLITLGAGAAVFLIGRLAGGGLAPYPPSGDLVVLNTLAAVAEEALFRRVAYAALLPAGPATAIVGSAVLFGLAHATVYGWWAVPLDTAAGLVFGWQRWVSGTWLLPAFTHSLADLLVVI